jgi:hypothetical protein
MTSLEPTTGAHAMSIPRTLTAILSEHTTLEVESIDRMYLHFYIPILQQEAGIAHFFQSHRGHRFVSSTQMGPMSRAFVGSIERFADREGIPIIRFRRKQRKEEVAKCEWRLDEAATPQG